MNIQDLHQAMVVIRNDANDTIAKLSNFSGILANFTAILGEDIEDISTYISDMDQDSDALTGYTFPVGNKLISMKWKTFVEFVYDEVYGKGWEFTFNNQVFARLGWTEDTKFIVCKYNNTGGDLNPYEMTVYDDPLEFDLNNFIFKLRDGSEFNFPAIVNQFKGSLQTQNFLLDLTNTVGGSASIQAIMTKWSAFSDWTAGAKTVFDHFATTASASVDDVVQWLAGMYSSASDVSESDCELSFSDTDYSVMLCWDTVIQGVFSAISSAITVITAALQGVAKIVAAVIGLGVSLVVSLWNKVANPLLEIKDNARMALQIPIAQITLPSSSLLNKLSPLKAATVDTPFMTIRYWYTEGTGYCELFLRPILSPMAINLLYGTSSFISQVGFLGSDSYFNQYVNNVPDSYKSPCGPSLSPTEVGQSITLAANLYLMFCFFGNVTTTMTSKYNSESNLLTWWSEVEDTSLSIADRAASCYCIMRRCWEVCHSSWEILTKDASTIASMIGSSIMTWNKFCNKLIPVIRSYWDNVYHLAVGVGIDFDDFGQRQLFNQYVEIGTSLELGVPSCKSYGIVTPRNSSDGFLLGAVLTLVAVIAVTAATVILSRKVKAKIKQKQLTLSTQLEAKKKAFQNAVNGIDNSDPTGSTPKTYTKEEQAQLFKDYYKSVKKYNRLSILWGGETFNMVNGWNDGAQLSTIQAVPSPEQSPIDSLQNILAPVDGYSYSTSEIMHAINGAPLK